MDIGSAAAREAGISGEQLRALGEYRESSLFSELERLAMDYAVAMTQTPVEVPDELFSALGAHLDPGQLVELTYVIGWENFRARTNHAMGIEAAGFTEGGACAVAYRAADSPTGAGP